MYVNAWTDDLASLEKDMLLTFNFLVLCSQCKYVYPVLVLAADLTDQALERQVWSNHWMTIVDFMCARKFHQANVQ